MILASTPPLDSKARFTQPRDHSIADPCEDCGIVCPQKDTIQLQTEEILCACDVIPSWMAAWCSPAGIAIAAILWTDGRGTDRRLSGMVMAFPDLPPPQPTFQIPGPAVARFSISGFGIIKLGNLWPGLVNHIVFIHCVQAHMHSLRNPHTNDHQTWSPALRACLVSVQNQAYMLRGE